MPKAVLTISGFNHRDLELAIIDSGLRVTKKPYTVDGETLHSIFGSKVTNGAGIKVGDVRTTRAGLSLRMDPTLVAPSVLASLMSLTGNG